mgnify:CR=1 FL=1
MAAERNHKKEYAARKEYLKAYRKKNKVKDKHRTRARRKMKCGKGKEVDHIDNNAKNNNRSNLKCISRKANRQKGARKTNSIRASVKYDWPLFYDPVTSNTKTLPL